MRNRIPYVLPRFLGGSSLAVVILCLASASADDAPSAEEVRATGVLDAIEKRMASPPVDAPQMRKELLNFRVKYPGTRAAIKAAALMGTLPSALDRMSPNTIPALEKFDWQPKDL